MVDTVEIYLFYPLLFLLLVMIIGISGAIIIKNKDNGLFNNIFNKHVDEHQDTTEKMKQMHDIVVPVKYTSVQEKELHFLECGLKELQYNVAEINKKVDDLTNRVLQLENNS